MWVLQFLYSLFLYWEWVRNPVQFQAYLYNSLSKYFYTFLGLCYKCRRLSVDQAIVTTNIERSSFPVGDQTVGSDPADQTLSHPHTSMPTTADVSTSAACSDPQGQCYASLQSQEGEETSSQGSSNELTCTQYSEYTLEDPLNYSLWLPTPVPKLTKLNDFLHQCSEGRLSPVRSQMQVPLTECADSTSRYYKRKAKQVVHLVLDCIAPGQADELQQHLSKEEEKPTSDMQSLLVKIYEEAESSYTKKQILSIFVNMYTKSELQEMIPGLTKWRIDEARKHASEVGPGREVEAKTVTRSRLDMTKVDHFIDFVSNPLFLQDVAFGTKVLKLSTGQKLEIPGAVRTVIASRLIGIYMSYCEDIGFQPLGRSTLFTILQVNFSLIGY